MASQINKNFLCKTHKLCIFDDVKIIKKNNKNIISVSYFVLEKTYKNNEIYSEGLKFLSKTLDETKTKNNIFLRVYYDQSALNLKLSRDALREISKNKKTELVFINCSNLIKLEDSMFLPAIFRYIPYFDYPGNDVNYALIADIDYHDLEAEKPKLISKINFFDMHITENSTDLTFSSPLCYKPFWRKYDVSKFSFLGNENYGKIKLPISFLVGFLNKFIKKTDPMINDFINNYKKFINRFKNNELHKKKINTCLEHNCIFVYGFDELFLSYYLLPEVLKRNYKVSAHIRHPKGNMYVLLKKTFPPECGDIIIRDFSKKFKLNFNNFSEFENLFTVHDYEGVNKKLHKLWEDFHAFVLLNKHKYKCIDEKNYRCFYINSTYITDDNKEVFFTEKLKKQFFSDLKFVKNAK